MKIGDLAKATSELAVMAAQIAAFFKAPRA